ncbi:MAG: hypothetical protein ACYC6V_10615 [Bacillota bacterium]
MSNRSWWKWPGRDLDKLWPDPPRRSLPGKESGAGGGGEENKTEEPIQLSWLDALAFAIAMFQIILPYFLAVAGAILAVYGLFWLLFRH